jgi:MarR family transcriptional regulator, organic hydroperoxide resistance regulator
MTEERTGLEDMLCFELYAASRAMTSLYRPALDTLGLTYPQYIALRVLWERGPTTVRDLGNHLRLDSGTLSPLLKRLETQGHIRRHRGTTDERTVEIHLTDQGTQLRHQAADIPDRLACALGLDETAFHQLTTLLSRVRDSATTHTL